MARRRKRFIPRRDTTPEHRINGFIRVPQVRLTGENIDEINEENAGEKLVAGDIYSTNMLRKIADNVGLDLVEIAPKAQPPVVRIIDYKKFLYQKKRREKDLKAKTAKQVLKEIRFGPECGEHDFEFKLRHARNFLMEGAKVKAYVHFRGRSIVFKDRGKLLLLRFMKELEDVGAADQLPKMEGRRMIVILSPTKKPVKKGATSAKKSKSKKAKDNSEKELEDKLLAVEDTELDNDNELDTDTVDTVEQTEDKAAE